MKTKNLKERKTFLVHGTENGRQVIHKIQATDIEDAKGVTAMQVAYKLDKNAVYTIVPEKFI